ncbi:TPA: transcriptional regulator LsrR [Serratia fonticola]|uniref:transcriptional regulator LsrR n=1 Tax=Serratia fonticola TaxID=47917 RepID=UPI00217C7300|nr:transcriptional regulator LsrR [Serratia fonticola]CAI1621479.1 Transcriptional regulator lsrR [Serratia fonticola]CAI1813547.1 Transcriptional regulator lsrR [Serratia fonticola]CAI1942320.1 Transcriptional regulator lsrR [Serratia fonticola]CAI1942730.1 Transcriptional regulator lsrR [Serratia fonticola]
MTINDSALTPEHGMCEEEQVARIAWFYYHDGLTQSEISARLGLTRLKVSRLLEKGHQSGIIRVQINSRFEGCLQYEDALKKHFDLKNIRVLPALAEADDSVRLGIGAAHMLMESLEPQQLLAAGFGEATMSTLKRLSGFISSQQIRLVTLSGGVGPYMTGIGQLDAACSVSMIPAPLRASSADIARTLRDENSVRDVLLAAQAADVAVVGIGAVSQKDAATILRAGYITEGEQLMIGRKGAVGDILGYFFDTSGAIIPDMQIHQELIGLSLSALATIPTVVGVAGGVPKAEAIVAALKGGYINALVTDQDTAAEMLKLIGK